MVKNKVNQPKVSFCPSCRNNMAESESLVIEYWLAEKTVNFCWCHNCGWRGEISEVISFTATEVEE
jgi:C4-type Zn-finger protein